MGLGYGVGKRSNKLYFLRPSGIYPASFLLLNFLKVKRTNSPFDFYWYIYLRNSLFHSFFFFFFFHWRESITLARSKMILSQLKDLNSSPFYFSLLRYLGLWTLIIKNMDFLCSTRLKSLLSPFSPHNFCINYESSICPSWFRKMNFILQFHNLMPDL